MPNKEDLAQAAHHYLDILQRIGQGESDPREIEFLCAQNCKKVRNGKVLFESRDAFAEQLEAGKQWLGAWWIKPQDIIVSTDQGTASIRYELSTQKEGDLIVFVTLYYDANSMIREINEVHNHLEK